LLLLISDNGVIASYKPVTYSDASIILSLFRTDGEVVVFERVSASLVTGKTDKMDTDHEASFAWTDLVG